MTARTFVSLDLETTGLDTRRDRITEIGMVRFTRAGVESTYSQLVNPERAIPLRVQQLTGIAPADVAGAPHFNSLRLDVEDFLGDATIVGQNIGFDLSVLSHADLSPRGDVLDTLELARLLDPAHRNHSLAALAARYDVGQPQAHRALADAETTRSVFLALYDRAEALPDDILAELIALADGMAWSPATLLRDVAAERAASARAAGEDAGRPAPPSPRARPRPPVPANQATDSAPAPPESGAPPQIEITPTGPAAGTIEEIALSVLAAGGRNPEPFGVWEERPEQVGMARAVAGALEGGGELIVEAGTGTGKSLAYLIPTALHALSTGTRAVVSTNTINLQEQLIAKDIPALRVLLRDTLGDDVADGLRVTALKGRRNYLCRRRVAQERAASTGAQERAASTGAQQPAASTGAQERATNPVAADGAAHSGPQAADPLTTAGLTSEAGSAASRLLARLVVWLQTTETGDRADLRVGPDEESAWSYFSAEGEDCLSSRSCPYVRDGSCFLLRARRRADSAHIIVANHALLLSDMAVGGGVIPAAGTLIVDEAHHLEDAATQHLGAALRVASFTDLLERVHRLGPRGGDQGVVGATRSALAAGPGAALTEDDAARDLRDVLLRQLRHVPATIAQAATTVEDFFIGLHAFTQDHARTAGSSDERLRLTRGVRVQPAWSTIEERWDTVFQALREVDDVLAELEDTFGDVASLVGRQTTDPSATQSAAGRAQADFEGLAAEVGNVRAALAERCERCGDLLTRHDEATVTWLGVGRRSEFATLHAAPLAVAERLSAELFGKRRATIVTGATLTVDNTFDYLQERLGLSDAATERFGSPFNYRQAVRLLLPTDMPAPDDPDYQHAIEESLIDLTMASEGRALALFTSHGALRAAARGVRDQLEAAGIVVLAQGVDGSPARVLDALRAYPRSLVLGTASLWEGVDIPGQTVSLLVIARLPFAVPTDPVYAARSDEYEDPFGRYAIPQAITRFRQGFGRLIRRKDDRGVVAVLDGRVSSKRYGEAFIRSLPPVSLERLPRHALGGSATAWLAQ